MSKNVQQESIAFIQDMDQAIVVMLVGTKQEDSRTSAFYQKTVV